MVVVVVHGMAWHGMDAAAVTGGWSRVGWVGRRVKSRELVSCWRLLRGNWLYVDDALCVYSIQERDGFCCLYSSVFA